MVPAGRVAQGAHEVGAVGHRQQASGQRHRRAAAAAARTDGGVPCVGRGAEHLVEGVRTQAQLGQVGLADDDAAGRLHPLRHHAVPRRDRIRQQRAALGGGKAFRVAGVLDRLRDAVQPASAGAAGQFGIAGAGLGQQRLIGREVDDRVQARVEGVDACQIRLHHFAAGHLARVDQVREGAGIEVGEVGGGGQRHGGHCPSAGGRLPGGWNRLAPVFTIKAGCAGPCGCRYRQRRCPRR